MKGKAGTGQEGLPETDMRIGRRVSGWNEWNPKGWMKTVKMMKKNELNEGRRKEERKVIWREGMMVEEKKERERNETKT